ncbi:uncharacterized protein G2W53_021417 [Senna tora]|uniref:Uncharacterized protein n=1 Tax=Senna tora TaxID=362788 RepID=A0A834TJG2_9FABA|nr:uncharacterized protein G2W53_021417 [Senna tora]
MELDFDHKNGIGPLKSSPIIWEYGFGELHGSIWTCPNNRQIHT